MEKTPSPLNFLKHTIPSEEAVFRTTQWRSLYMQKMKCEEKHVLKAFLIPIEDIIELYNFYKEHTDLNITGVRGYIGHNPLGPVTEDLDVDMLLVPVTADGKDVTEVPPGLAETGATSTIYDFTNPCPTVCDTTSILYSATNVVK
jgi:hypothetical protein